ncbi:T-cell surface antigen CD2 [Hoplias malabaricus]|uniref:T-cell surface antigen CD2 n=1 Tax=Hoplias malabaricus TaxID=27720 RepID=UPI0034629DA7
MHFKVGVTLSLFCVLIFFSITECSSENCANKAKVGGSVTIQLSKPEAYYDIKWKHANKNIIRRKDINTTSLASNTAMDDKGSLRLQNVKIENAGEYSVECYSKDGILKLKDSTTLCVYDKIPKPNVNFTCQNGKPSVLRCEVTSSNVEFSWNESGKKLSTGPTFAGKDNRIYQCIVSNPFYNNTSGDVPVSCSPKPSEGQKLFGFDLWIMVGILAGGGGLVLLLIIVLVTCACQSCKRREKHLQDEDELRLNTFHTPPQRSKYTARGQPAPPVPQEDPEVSNYEVNDPQPKTQPRTKNQPRVRPPPPPVDDDDEQPPPLPQPRKKVQNPKKHQGPLYMQP